MASPAHSRLPRLSTAFSPAPGALVVLTAAALLVVGLAAVTYRYPLPSPEFLLLAGVGLTGVSALAVARYDAAVTLGFLLLGVVRVEPAPPDLVFAVVILVAAMTGRFDLRRVPIIVLVSLGVYLSLTLLSIVEVVDADRAVIFTSITLYLAVFALWLTGYVTSERRARLVVSAYLITAVASAALASLALFVAIPGQDVLTAYSRTRAVALFKDPNVFGPFMVPILMVVLEEAWRPRLLRLGRAMRLIIPAVLAIGVLFSYSRSAWLNLAVSLAVLLVVFMLRSERAPRWAGLAAILLVAGACTTAVVATTDSSDFLQERAGVQSYDASRFDAQRVGLQLAERNPIGTGPGQYEPVVQYAAHSTYIRVFTEQGPAGLIAFLLLSGATLAIAVRNAVVGQSTYGIGSAALLAAWCGLLVNSLFVDTLHWRHLWVVAALIWAAAPQARARGPSHTAGASRP